MGAFTRVDVLFQAYFVAFLVCATMGVPRNPGNPYVASTKQNGFGTFGPPDIAATLAAFARAGAQRRLVPEVDRPPPPPPRIRRRHRPPPEDGPRGHDPGPRPPIGARLPGGPAEPVPARQLPARAVLPRGLALRTRRIQQVTARSRRLHYRPEVLLRRRRQIQNPVVPSSDGHSLGPYTGRDAWKLTVNGELNKLAHKSPSVTASTPGSTGAATPTPLSARRGRGP